MEHQVANALVLVVEDDPRISRLIARVLRVDLGITTRVVSDGVSGLYLATKLTPDLVLLDINLPGLNGLEVARHLRANPDTRAVPIVAVSSDYEEEAMAAGCDGFVAKPFTVRDLTETVRAYLH